MVAATLLPAQERSRDGRATADFPQALAGDTRKLEFRIARSPNDGSFRDQARGALADLLRRNRDATIIKLRVFAARDEDIAAIEGIVREEMTTAGRPLPVLSIIKSAGFAVSQQVVIESTAAANAVVNPNGLVLLGGLAAPTSEQAASGLARVAKEAGVSADDVLRVSCLYESADQLAATQAAIPAAFPRAEVSYVHSYAAASAPKIECEGVARLPTVADTPVRYFNLAGTTPSPIFSRAAIVAAPKLVFTGTMMAFGDDERAMRDLFERTKRAVEPLGARLPNVVMSGSYWLTASARDSLRPVRMAQFSPAVPAATAVFFAGLADKRATVAIELVLAIP